MIERGSIAIQRQLPGGAVDHLRTMEAGSSFGELGPMFGLPRTATARAAEASRLTGYPLAEYKGLVGVDKLASLLAGPPPSPPPS